MDSIESRGTVLNTGKLMKDTFIDYRKELLDVKPFMNSKIYNAEYFKNVMASFEGNHMSFYTPPIQILEACMTDARHKPIMALQDKSLRCVDSVCELIINLLRNITLQEEFAQFPNMASNIMASLIDEIISKNKEKSKLQINELLKKESEYIWTDSGEFVKDLAQVTKTGTFDLTVMIKFLEGYFSAVKNIVSHSVPKIVMSNVIRDMESSILSFLLHTTVTEDKICLLAQHPEIEKQRAYYSDLKQRVLTIKKGFKTN